MKQGLEAATCMILRRVHAEPENASSQGLESLQADAAMEGAVTMCNASWLWRHWTGPEESMQGPSLFTSGLEEATMMKN